MLGGFGPLVSGQLGEVESTYTKEVWQASQNSIPQLLKNGKARMQRGTGPSPHMPSLYHVACTHAHFLKIMDASLHYISI
jgi:hypothetical protein